ncbi:hypothetical protein V1505DRAFT_366931 [Lipomyces doorenjongii]
MNNGSSTNSTDKLGAGLPYPDSLPHLLAELNTLFSQYGIPASIPVFKQDDRTIVQVHPNSLLDMYNAVFDPDSPLARPVQDNITSRVKSVKLLIGTISQDILKMDLSYIDPLAVVAGDEDAIRELLRVVVALGMTVRQKQRRVAQMQELAQAVDDDAYESEVSVEPNSEYSDDEDSDQGHASDLSSGVSITKWKTRATLAINRIGPLRSSSSYATDSIQRTVSDVRFARMLREYSPFGRAHSPSSLLSIHKTDRLTRSFPNKSSPALLHVSTRTNRISKALQTPRQQWLRHSFSHLRRPLHYLHMASRAYQTTVPVTIASPKCSRSASMVYGIRQRNSRRNLLGSAQTAMFRDYNDEWITDDDDLGGHCSTPEVKYGDIKLSETSNEQIRIPAHYLESQQLSHIKLSGLSSSYAGLSLAASRGVQPNDLGVNILSEGLVPPRNSDHLKKRTVDLLSKSYQRPGGLRRSELPALANTVITRNENFVSPKKRSKFLHLKIDSAISAPVDDSDDDEDIDDENTSLSITEMHVRASRRRMRRLTGSQSVHDKRERELRSKFMGLNVG